MQENSFLSSKENKRYFIVVFGPPASGKTTLAHKIKASLLAYHQKELEHEKFVVISADCLEQFLSRHSVNQLESTLEKQNGWEIIHSYKLKRSLFRQEVWKKSRDFIKKNLDIWLSKWKVVILQDDLLLKSQRKQMRQLVQHSQVLYLEIMMNLSFEECLSNSIKRNQMHQNEEKLSIQVLKECFHKFQPEQNEYCIPWKPQYSLSWNTIELNAKKVVIEHPELKQKEQVSEQNAAKDIVQTQIRSFISEILKSQELLSKYFKEKSTKQVAPVLSKLKKNYKDKSKSLEGFKAYLQNYTSKML